jgi:hypothetical protein
MHMWVKVKKLFVQVEATWIPVLKTVGLTGPVWLSVVYCLCVCVCVCIYIYIYIYICIYMFIFNIMLIDRVQCLLWCVHSYIDLCFRLIWDSQYLGSSTTINVRCVCVCIQSHVVALLLGYRENKIFATPGSHFWHTGVKCCKVLFNFFNMFGLKM